MSDETPSVQPPRPPRGRPRPQPKGFADDAILSDEEVERRVGVRGGGTPRAPIERGARVPRTPRRAEKTTARDSLLLIGLVIVGLVAVRVFLPDGPLTANPTATPDPSLAAVVTLAPPASPTQGPTPGLQTLTPIPTPTGGPATTVPSVAPTVALPTPTLKPGETPRPTPKPTATPRVTTPPHTPGPTPTSGPGTATVHVVMHVINNSGGSSSVTASDWIMKITGEVGSGVSPNNFAGSESGTTVTITAGKGYLVTDNVAVAGYSFSRSADCSRSPGVGLPAGADVTCTVTRNDIAPRLNLTIAYSGTEASAELSVSGANATPSSVTATGATTVTLDANASWSVSEVSGPSGYTLDTSGTCSSSGLALAAVVSCTYTYTENPPSPAAVPLLFLPFLRPRRWRPTATG